ncbi:hypothetical protein H4219_005117 [Mycoemilia scoparia]|uniref:Uncharacterized protein n=1 Tax=Mycoemilia scoparia TaxID=417184 RepID=A0A9W8DQP3_9FUNG|nr:hypothetical protein H4219_005117 [Mycoemilia scoparia]
MTDSNNTTASNDGRNIPNSPGSSMQKNQIASNPHASKSTDAILSGTISSAPTIGSPRPNNNSNSTNTNTATTAISSKNGPHGNSQVINRPTAASITRRVVTNSSVSTAKLNGAISSNTPVKGRQSSQSQPTRNVSHGRSQSTASSVSSVTQRSDISRNPARKPIGRRETTTTTTTTLTNHNNPPRSGRHLNYPKSASLATESNTFAQNQNRTHQYKQRAGRSNTKSPALGLTSRRARSANTSRSASPNSHIHRGAAQATHSETPDNPPGSAYHPRRQVRRGISNASGTDSDYSANGSSITKHNTARKASTNIRNPSPGNLARSQSYQQKNLPPSSSLTAHTVSSLMRRVDPGQGTSTPIPNTANCNASGLRQPSPTSNYNLNNGSFNSQLRSPTPLYPLNTNRGHLPPIPSVVSTSSTRTPTSGSSTDKRLYRNGVPVSQRQRPQPKITGGSRFQSLELNRLRAENEQLSVALDTQMALQEEQQLVVRDLANTVEDLQTQLKVSEQYVSDYLETIRSIEDVADALRNENQALRECLKLYTNGEICDGSNKSKDAGSASAKANSYDRKEMKRELSSLLKAMEENKLSSHLVPYSTNNDVIEKDVKSDLKSSPKIESDYNLLKDFLQRQEIRASSPIKPSPGFEFTAGKKTSSENYQPMLSIRTDISLPNSAALPPLKPSPIGVQPLKLASPPPNALPNTNDRSEEELAEPNTRRRKLPHQRSARRRSSFLLQDFIPPSLPPTAPNTGVETKDAGDQSKDNECENGSASKPQRPLSSIVFGANMPSLKNDAIESPRNTGGVVNDINQSLAAILSPNTNPGSAHLKKQNRNMFGNLASITRSRSSSHTNYSGNNVSNIKLRPLIIPSPGQFTGQQQHQGLLTSTASAFAHQHHPYPTSMTTNSTIPPSPIVPFTANSALTFDSNYTKPNPDCPRCLQLLESLKYLEIDNDYYRETNQRLRDQVSDAVSRHNALVRLFEKERNRRRERRAQGIIDEARIKAATLNERTQNNDEDQYEYGDDEDQDPSNYDHGRGEADKDDDIIHTVSSNDKENEESAQPFSSVKNQMPYSPDKQFNKASSVIKANKNTNKNLGIGIQGLTVID